MFDSRPSIIFQEKESGGTSIIIIYTTELSVNHAYGITKAVYGTLTSIQNEPIL